MQDFLSITKALSDESRVRVLMALTVGELCVCQITELLKLAPSTVSKHMSILKQARLVEGEKSGKWVYYRLTSHAPKAAAEAIEWAKRHLVMEDIIKRDANILRAILKQHPVEVCKKQKASRATRINNAGTVTKVAVRARSNRVKLQKISGFADHDM